HFSGQEEFYYEIEKHTDTKKVSDTDSVPESSGYVNICSDGIQYPTAYPEHYIRRNTEVIDTESWDLKEFAVEMRKHLCDGEIFYFIAGGNEGSRYVSFEELAVSHETHRYRNA